MKISIILINDCLIRFFESQLILNNKTALTLNDRLIFKNIRSKFIVNLVIEIKLALIIEINITWIVDDAAVNDCKVDRSVSHFHFGLAIMYLIYILFTSCLIALKLLSSLS